MFCIRNFKFNKKEVIIHPGDYYSSNEDIVISTILGSCISVILFDETKKQGGMNHFLLPQLSQSTAKSLVEDQNSRYGVYAMEILINDLLKLGSRKSDFKAKIFGGAAMFGPLKKENGIGALNIQFARQFLETEGIPIIASNTGEDVGRKIFFFPQTGQVLMRKIHSKSKILDLKQQDEGFKQTITDQPPGDKIVLF